MSRTAKWKRLPALEGGHHPCLNCPDIETLLDMGRVIAVGFGDAALERDGETVWQEAGNDFEDCLSVERAEEMAARDEDHDWRIVLHGPLHGETYQRHGPRAWVLVEKNEGFA